MDRSKHNKSFMNQSSNLRSNLSSQFKIMTTLMNFTPQILMKMLMTKIYLKFQKERFSLMKISKRQMTSSNPTLNLDYHHQRTLMNQFKQKIFSLLRKKKSINSREMQMENISHKHPPLIQTLMTRVPNGKKSTITKNSKVILLLSSREEK